MDGTTLVPAAADDGWPPRSSSSSLLKGVPKRPPRRPKRAPIGATNGSPEGPPGLLRLGLGPGQGPPGLGTAPEGPAWRRSGARNCPKRARSGAPLAGNEGPGTASGWEAESRGTDKS
eukprot:scaffold2250_cov399-Prasinococcus_capsulatus_cf.AAC.10